MGTLAIYNYNIWLEILLNLAICSISAIFFYKLVKFLLPFANKPLLEKKISDILPFKDLVNDSCLLLKDGTYAQIIVLQGLDYTSLNESVIKSLSYSRYVLYKDLATKGIFFKIFIKKNKVNEYFEINNSDIRLINDIFAKVSENLDKSYEVKYYIFCQAKKLKDLEDIIIKFTSVFNDFRPKLLKSNKLLQTLWYFINHYKYDIDYAHKDIHYLVSNSHHSFDKYITIKNNHIELYATIYTLNAFSEQANSKLINEILSLNFQLEIIINTQIYENNVSIFKINSWKKLNSFLGLTRNKSNQANTLLEGIENQEESLINTQFSFVIYANTLEELSNNKKEFLNVITSKGVNTIEEYKGLEISYFNRFVGFNKNLRPRPITSSNLTHLVEFHATNKGLNSCEWGNYPMAYFKNYDGSIYKFFLHLNDNKGETPPAHTVSFAPTGSGKTFLFQHIIAGALYFYKNVNIYCFDSNLGLKVFTESVNGTYLELKSQNITINPLLLDLEDLENQLFLGYWFKLISMCEDDQSLDYINNAIEIIKALPYNNRKLSVCLPSIFPANTVIYKSLEKFAYGIHKDLFNGDNDNLSLNTNRLFAFDMTNVLKDETVCPAFLSYIMFVIRKHAKKTNQPHIVFIDETSAMLQNKIFAKYISVLLKEHRKLQGSINVVFQNVSDLTNVDGENTQESLVETILGQCKTRLIFKNNDANEKIYEKYLNLKSNHINIIKGLSQQFKHLKRPLVIQKGNNITVVDSDLSYLGKLTRFYSSSINNINLLKKLKSNSEDWYKEYKEC